MPCPEWWIQRWTALVRKVLGWRAPIRRGGRILSRKRRERETRAAISADVTRFLEEAEGAEEDGGYETESRDEEAPATEQRRNRRAGPKPGGGTSRATAAAC